MPKLVRNVMWNRLDTPGCEYFGLWRDGEGWQIRGTVVCLLDDEPAYIRYGILCGPEWKTQAVHLAVRNCSGERALHLDVRPGGCWYRGSEEVSSVRGCLDIDLEVTPGTNTLPIRRAGAGDARVFSARAAWVRFPDLTIEPLDQTYERSGPNLYRYRTDSGFEALLSVDDLGIIRRYGDVWNAVGCAGVPD